MKLQLKPITKGIVVSAAGGLILLHGSGFSLSSVDAQQKSSIQAELEKLYQQDGRQAPDMQVKSLPRDTTDGRVFQESSGPGQLPVATRPGEGGIKYDPSQLSSNRIPVPPQTKRKGLLDRLMFWKKDKPAPRPVAQPSPQPPKTAAAPRRSAPQTPANRTATLQKQPAAASPAPPADVPYQRPVSYQSNTLPPAPSASASRQPVTLELPMNDFNARQEAARPSAEPPLPRWNPSAPQQPVRQPLISTQPQLTPGQMPVIIPKAPPAPEDFPGTNRVVIRPTDQFESQDKAALLPETDDANTLALPLPPEQPPSTSTEQSPFAEPKPIDQPRPMPSDLGPDPAFAAELPAAEEEQPLQAETPKPAATLPSLDELPNEPLPIIPEEKEEPVAKQPPMGTKGFPDPFTDVSEQEADSSKTDMTIPDIQMNDAPAAELPADDAEEQPAEAPAAPQLPEIPAERPAEDAGQPVAEDENPFSGLKLDSAEAPAPPIELEPGAAPMLPLENEGSAESLETPSAAPSLPAIDPAFDDDFKLPVKKDTSERPMPDQPILEKIPESPLPNLPAAEESDISWEEDQARREAKLALIAAREGETGMKGFCIVELRNNRDLVDAVPAFRSTYNLRTYHFSSLESKIEFDKDPRKFVPAYDGNDPILLSTESEEREGSLDHALWFKGRLYLFTSLRNLEFFQADPVLYSEN